MRRSAFTLIELLIVIGIIAVILSLLLATLHSARESARRTACLGNLRQIGHAIVMYVNDNKGQFPASAIEGNVFRPEDWIWWRAAHRPQIRHGGIGRYLDLSADNYAVMICPSDQGFRLRGLSDPYIFSYAMNWMFASQSNAPIRYKRITAIRNPSEKVLAFEEDERTIDDGNGSIWLKMYDGRQINLLAIRHDRARAEHPDIPSTARPVPNPMRQGNVVFADGHAAYIPRRLCHSKLHAVGNSGDFPADPDFYP
jgi:prepilin-type N-terminal cleavage/methylation domain-containing protein/prepilin-type processing-associated H-X9-DG protein